MTLPNDIHNPGRRAFLQRAGLAAAAGAALPLLSSTASPAFAAVSGDPDQLFKQGKFSAAERGYRRLLHKDRRNARALAQLGYMALLSNRFRDAETYLSKAVALQPTDIASAQRLAESYVRRDQFARAVPLLQGTGRPRDKSFAEMFSHIKGEAWQLSGPQSTRVPFHTLDPVPSVEATLNGGKPQKFWLDTYGTLDLSPEVAEAAGIRAVATMEGGFANNRPINIYLGVLESFRIGDIEMRNIPVQWSDVQRPPLPDGSAAAGAFGTTIFYHFLTTMDYAGKALILRRKTESQLRRFRAEAARTGYDRLPLWLAGDHFPCSMGSLGDYGPRMVTVDTGGIGAAFDSTVEIAKQVGFEVDLKNPIPQPGNNKLYWAKGDRISLGKAVQRNVRGRVADKVFPGFPGPGQSAQFGFDLIANFTHEFFKPYAITFDYTNMHLYIAGKSLR
ncbi:aspartyl protease family protein [Sinosporangium siamense]|uniref:Tetratricopeptide repeat protein n=1 Tax=Sinosporangium siamense TaxID=1367973 RepID=A0A919RKL9_9ACTN|nr:tetratricopeptide repeat protein [Sinosporangium siamense]GII95575.1 hypothetical protein Ssi02_58060 [Sinosporangium siamense]